MIIKTAEFEKSSEKLSQCPEGELPEFAFIGRSNVGKSSLINLITNRRNLAKISVTPGKTKLINHFLINNSWYLVDLPGYGYARVSKKSKEIFNKLILDYILKRDQLMCVFLLVDARINPQLIDLKFIDWLGSQKIPFVLVFTKTDKISGREIQENINKFKDILHQNWETLPQSFFSSAKKKSGKQEILTFIQSLIDPKKSQD